MQSLNDFFRILSRKTVSCAVYKNKNKNVSITSPQGTHQSHYRVICMTCTLWAKTGMNRYKICWKTKKKKKNKTKNNTHKKNNKKQQHSLVSLTFPAYNSAKLKINQGHSNCQERKKFSEGHHDAKSEGSTSNTL